MNNKEKGKMKKKVNVPSDLNGITVYVVLISIVKQNELSCKHLYC